MNLNLFYSNTFRGSFDNLCKELKQNLNTGKMNYVIVPDRFSLTIEKAVLDKIGIVGSMDIEVVSFSRLAGLLLGSRIFKCLSPDSAVMLLAKVIREHKSELKCYGKVRDISSFAQDMYATISEIRNNDITPDMLIEAQKKVSNHGIDIKTSDIIMLYQYYLSELQGKYNDATTRLEKLAEEIPYNDVIANSHIYITDFYSFKQVEYNIISALSKHSLSVDIALVSSPDSKSLNRRIYPNYKIEALLDELKIEYKKIFNHYPLNPINQTIERRLFSYDTLPPVDSSNRVRLYHSSSIDKEIVNAAKDIKSKIRQGLRYRDIAIICGDISQYTMYIESIFKRFDIPYYIDNKMQLKSHPLIRFLFAIYDYIDDQSINYIIDIAKNPFAEIDSNDSDIFENYCIKYNIKGGQIKNKFDIGNDQVELQISEAVRLQIINIISALKTEKMDSVDNYITNTKNLLQNINTEEIMQQIAKSQVDNNNIGYSEITKQIPVKLNDVFNETAEILGEQIVSFDEFITLVKANISSVKVSMIPQFIDSVFVGEPIESRYALVKVLYVLGANDNAIPINHKDMGILTQYECKEWNLDIFPTAKQSSNLDKLLIQQLLIKPELQLIISYSSRSETGDHLSPSIIIRQLQRIFGLQVKSVDRDNIIDYNMSEECRAEYYANQFATYDNALNELVIMLRKFKEAKVSDYDILPFDAMYQLMDSSHKEHLLEINNLHKDHKPYISNSEDLFFKKSKSTSVSQLEAYFTCPFQHFIKYGIRATKRKNMAIEAIDIGNIIHKALELFILKILNENTQCDIEDSIRDEIIASVLSDVMQDSTLKIPTDKSIMQLLVNSIKRTLVFTLECIGHSDYKPYLAEVGFGEGCQYPSIVIPYADNKKLNLRGKIDRVDNLDNSIIIIDYKTGTNASKSDLKKELYYGKKIQLFVYLKALSEFNKPAGLFYMQMSNNYQTHNKDIYSYNGLIVDDYVASFDPRANRLINTAFKSKNIIAEDTLNNMLNYSIEIASYACKELSEGYIESKPYKNCDYCDYYDICHARFKEPSFRSVSACKDSDFERGGVSDV